MSDSFADFIERRVARGQDQFADVTRALVYKLAPIWFDLLNFDDPEIFLEPLLFAYFSAQEPQMPIEQLLFGYVRNDRRPPSISVRSDDGGVVYLPRVGYFATSFA